VTDDPTAVGTGDLDGERAHITAGCLRFYERLISLFVVYVVIFRYLCTELEVTCQLQLIVFCCAHPRGVLFS
jgi:hypothetical protein